MTDWRDTLLTISEIAIAIIGFTGLIGILARRQRVEVFSEEFFKLRFMLEYGLPQSAPCSHRALAESEIRRPP